MEHLNELVVRARTGDLDAYTAIVERFQDMALGYAYALVGDRHLAEDVAQESFLQAHLDLARLREPRAFPGWFRKIVWKHCTRVLRQRRATVPIETLVPFPAVEESPAEAVETRDRQQLIQEAIQDLPPQERQTVVLFYMGSYARQDIATFLDVPVTTVDNRLRFARQKLKKRILDMTKKTLKETAPSQDDRFVRQLRDNIEQRWAWFEKVYELAPGEHQDTDTQLYHRLAEAVAEQYNLGAIEMKRYRNRLVIGGTVSFLVESDRTPHRAILHLYNPLPSEDPRDHRHNPVGLLSGLQWLDALGRDTDLRVQHPIPNRSGELLTSASGVADASDPTYGAVLSWVDGEMAPAWNQRTLDQIRAIGVLMAQVHDYAARWTIPEGFSVINEDSQRLMETLEVLRWASSAGRLPDSDIPVIEATAERIDDLLTALGHDRDVWGINGTVTGWYDHTLYLDSSAGALDYSLWLLEGHYLTDLSGIMIWMGVPGYRQALVEGYHSMRPLPDDHEHMLETLYLMGQLHFLAAYAENPGEDLVTERLLVQNECERYLKGEPFLFV